MYSNVHNRFFSAMARPEKGKGELMPIIYRQDGDFTYTIKVGDEIGYYEWFYSTPDNIYTSLTAGLVVDIEDLVITYKPYKFREETQGREFPEGWEWVTYRHWIKDDFEDETSFHVERTHPNYWGPLKQINKEFGLDYWRSPPEVILNATSKN